MKRQRLFILMLIAPLACIQEAAERASDFVCTTTERAAHLLEQAKQHKNEEQYNKAIEYYQQAFTLKPGNLQDYFSLAHCCIMMGNSALALATYKRLLKSYPNCISILYNIAYILKMDDNIDLAIPFYKKTIEMDPEREESYFGLGMAYLVKGDFKNGWATHERYLKRTDRNANLFRSFLKNGEYVGKTLLLRPEGGLGDTIQFLRYAKTLRDAGINVIVSVQKELYPLVRNCDYIDTLFKTGDTFMVHYDDSTTLMSIPAIWYDHTQEIPQEIPYIQPSPELTLYWHERLKYDHNFKIGICWGASIHNDSSRAPVARRSIPLELLLPLHAIPGVSLYSLQCFDGEEQLEDIPDTVTIHTFGPDFDKTYGPFMDSAAIMQNLDLIISVDTATAHLAGALGRPVFVLLPYSTDWRWIAHRTDSPWYPTMRIFKQKKPFDWEPVIAKVCEAVKEQMHDEH